MIDKHYYKCEFCGECWDTSMLYKRRRNTMNNITREKESSFELDILNYIDLAIEDKDTDGDRVVGYILACLSAQHKINIARVTQFYKEAREKIS